MRSRPKGDICANPTLFGVEKKTEPIVQALVVKKLTNPRDCDVHDVCEANPVAEGVRLFVCLSVCVCLAVYPGVRVYVLMYVGM